MSLRPLLPQTPLLPLFHTPGPFQKGRADSPILFPIGSHHILPRRHRSLPSSEGLGVCPYILTFFFILPTPFKRGGLTRSLYSPDRYLQILPRRHRELPSSEGLGVCL